MLLTKFYEDVLEDEDAFDVLGSLVFISCHVSTKINGILKAIRRTVYGNGRMGEWYIRSK